MSEQQAISNLDAALAADNARIVARNGSLSWTRLDLAGFFDRVVDKDNWKYAIDARVTVSTDWELLGIREAVIFFTGSVPTLDAIGAGDTGTNYRVRANGYYQTIGA